MNQRYSTELPADYERLVQVFSLQALFDTARNPPPGVNVVVWRRGALAGDFNRLAEILSRSAFQCDENQPAKRSVNFEHHREVVERHCKAHPSEEKAVQQALLQVEQDHKAFEEYGVNSECLYCLDHRGYGHGSESDRYHADGFLWRLLAAYSEPATLWLKNADAIATAKGDVFVPARDAVERKMQVGDVWMHLGLNLLGSSRNLTAPPFVHSGHKPAFGKHKLLYQALPVLV